MNAYYPAARSELIKELDRTLYKGWRARLKATLEEVHRAQNIEAGGPSFRYKGIVFPTDWAGTIRKLIPSAHAEMDEYFLSINKLVKESNMTMNYVRTALVEAKSSRAIYAMLPTSLHRILDRFPSIYPFPDDYIAKEEIDNFLKHNHKYITLLKSRMTYNLIMGSAK